MTRESAVELAMLWHGLDRESAEKYVDGLLSSGERNIRIHHEIVEIKAR